MAPKLYGQPFSPPTRAIFLCAKVLEVDLEFVLVDLFQWEQFKDKYLEKNPQHTVPLLEDEDGFLLADSHAIMSYLVAEYGKDDSLYPKNHRKRAIIDQQLHFDSSTLFARGLSISKPLIFEATFPIERQYEQLKEAYEITNKLLKNNEFIAGKNLSIADFSFVTTLTSWKIILDFEEFPNIIKYIEKMEKFPWYQENIDGLKDFQLAIIEKRK